MKVGNLKDPEKIAAKKAEAKKAFLERAALSALTGQVLAVGVKSETETDLFCHPWTLDESDLLSTFWTYVAEDLADNVLVGFNSHSFDLPFLVRRSFLLGVDVPDQLYNQRYWPAFCVDLLEIWRCGNRQDYDGLDAIDKALGGEGKPEGIDGGDFARLFNGTKKQREQALAYLRNDLDMTWRVAEALQVL